MKNLFLKNSWRKRIASIFLVSFLCMTVPAPTARAGVWGEEVLSDLMTIAIEKVLKFIEDMLKGIAKRLAVQIADKINNSLYKALLKYEKATILMTMGDLDESKLLLEQARPTFEKLEKNFDLGNVYKTLGSLAFVKQDLDSAKKYYEKGITYYHKTNAKKEIYKIRIFIGHIVLQKGGTKESIKIFDEVIKYYEKNNARADVPKALSAIAQAHFLLGEVSISAECLYKAMRIHEELGNFYGLLINYQNLSSMYNSDQHQKGSSTVAARRSAC